jgi:hypothetical protein
MLFECVALLRFNEPFRDECTLIDAQEYPRKYGIQIRIFYAPDPLRIPALRVCNHVMDTISFARSRQRYLTITYSYVTLSQLWGVHMRRTL